MLELKLLYLLCNPLLEGFKQLLLMELERKGAVDVSCEELVKRLFALQRNPEQESIDKDANSPNTKRIDTRCRKCQ